MLFSKKEPIYIVYPPDITTHVFEQAEILYRRLCDVFSVRAVMTHGEDLPEGENVQAFLLGNTGLSRAENVMRGITYGEGKIVFLGSLVILGAHTEESLLPLMAQLLDNLNSDGESLTVSFTLDGFSVKDPRFLHELPLYRGGKLIAYRRGHQESDQLLIGSTNTAEYEAYLRALSKAGYREISFRNVRGNLFARFARRNTGVCVNFTPFDSCTRIVTGPAASLWIQNKEQPPRSPVQPLLTVIGTRFSTSARYINRDAGAGNMSFVLRLPDGRFAVVDGGPETGAAADALHRVMTEQAPDPAHVTVAAWFVTHSHVDHLGGFLKFTEKYRDTVTLESFVCCYPSIDDAEYVREAWNVRRTFETLIRYWPDTRTVRAHAGDLIELGGASFDVLFTEEEIVRQYLTIRNEEYNNASMVMKVTVGGNTVTFMADAGETACKLICRMYGDYLKSDIVQVCHHGGLGGTVELYRLIDPETAVFGTSDALLPVYLSTVYNHELVYRQHVKEVINSSENIRVLPLPYHPQKRVVPPFPGKKLYRRIKWLESLGQMEAEGVIPPVIGQEDKYGL